MAYKHLTPEDRHYIHISRRGPKPLSIRAIAANLNRSPSTISREIRRNKGGRGYRHQQAQRMASERSSEAHRRNARHISEETKAWALKMVRDKHWSPMQVSGYAKKEGKPTVSHETIYQWIIQDKAAGGTIYLALRRKRRKYNKRCANGAGRGLIPNCVDISRRPRIVESRRTFGNWEADTMIGTQRRGKVLVTLDERHSRFRLCGLANSKTAEDVSAVIIELLKPFKGMVDSITYDNGKEFAYHEKVNAALGCKSYFARPYHSWERGTNENCNGLTRQYFPKGQSLDNRTSEEVADACRRINTRPRKVLGYETSLECFNRGLIRHGIAPVEYT